jgi:hypothetical protein
VSKRIEALGLSYFGPARIETELLNLPPLRIYRWRKRAEGPWHCAQTQESPQNATPQVFSP